MSVILCTQKEFNSDEIAGKQYYSHGIPRVRNFPIARQTVAGLLVEPVPDVRVLPLPQTAPGDVPGLVEVVPRHPAVGRLQTLQGHGNSGPRSGVVPVLRPGGAVFQSECPVFSLKQKLYVYKNRQKITILMVFHFQWLIVKYLMLRS